MRRIEAAAHALSFLGARVWEKPGRHRLYINAGGKDITAYFQYDEDAATEEVNDDARDLLAGAALKVYTDAQGTGSTWETNRRKQVMHKIMLDCEEADLIDEVCEDWREIILI